MGDPLCRVRASHCGRSRRPTVGVAAESVATQIWFVEGEGT